MCGQLQKYFGDNQEIESSDGDSQLMLKQWDKFIYSPWGGVCIVHMKPETKDIWMVREGKGTDGTGCWKT